jgi:hypothetical protein
MGKIVSTKDGIQEVTLSPSLYKEAFDAKLSVQAFVNRKYPTHGAAEGSAFRQLCAYEGIYLPKAGNDEGLRAQVIGDILDGKASLDAAVTQQRGDPYGGQSRLLFPAAVIDLIENQMPKDLDTEKRLFEQMIAVNLNIGSDVFEQPIINFSTINGPDGAQRAKAQRIAQLAEPAAMAIFTTSDTVKKLNTWSIGAEFSQQALRNTTLDLVALNLGRFLRVEQDGRTYQYLANLFTGDLDLNTGGAISAVTSSTLNGSATAGVLTHKAWVKWLYRNRKYRKIDFVVCDLDTYLKIEARTGRPGSIGVLDPTLPKIDPQATALNPYVDNVKVFLVDSAADGGPVPANTVWGIDSRDAIVRVTNTQAAYQAAEQFALKRSEAFRIDWSEDCYRQWDMAFDVLTID